MEIIQARADFTKKAQMKIQQMAFMVVAITIFFSMIALIYFSLTIASVESDAKKLQDEEARSLVRKLSSSPEFAFTSEGDCSHCIDLDKALQIKELIETNDRYEGLWNLDHLYIEIIHSSRLSTGECTSFSFPDDCDKITILEKSTNFATKPAFVTLVSWDDTKGAYKYEFGRIHASTI
jgi:hypothetical protein